MFRETIVSLLFAFGVFAADTPKPAQPSPATIDGPRTVTVSEKSVTPIYVCRFQETMVTLPEGEKVMKAAVGDTKNWKLESRSADTASRYISIKVVDPQTNQATLNVISDHDIPYTLQLNLSEQHCDSRVSIESDRQLTTTIQKTDPWLSPGDARALRHEVDQAKADVTAAEQRLQQSADAYRSTYPSKLRFDYRFDSKAAEKMGLEAIWHDDKFTYIRANPEETPALYELKQGKPSLISFDYANGLYWTGRVLNDGYLAVGGNGDGKHQQKVDFHRVEGN